MSEYATGAAGVGIPDPYGLTIAAYRNTLRQLYEYVEHVGIVWRAKHTPTAANPNVRIR